jgi:spore coat protein A, manganese oxidase
MTMTPLKLWSLIAATFLIGCSTSSGPGSDDAGGASGAGGRGGSGGSIGTGGTGGSRGTGGTGGTGGSGGTGGARDAGPDSGPPEVMPDAAPGETPAPDAGTADTVPVVVIVDAGGNPPVEPVIQVLIDGATIPKYVETVPALNANRVNGTAGLAVDMVEFQQRILPATFYAALPAPYSAGTYVWGYKVDATGPSWPGRTIEVQRGTATTVTYTNSLAQAGGAPPVLARYLTTDLTLHWADPLHTSHESNCRNGPPLAPACVTSYGGPIPAVVHLHGAEVLSQFDGHPDTWFTPGLALKGPAYVSNVYTYPNTQEATTLWYHDHALGRTRLNVYSGLAGFYLIRDARDTGRADNPITLPGGDFEAELMIADRQFDRNGQLFFPSGLPGNPTGINGPPPNPDRHPYWNPEFFGDVVTVNGKSWPFMTVQPRRYRFRIVNSSNARFYEMSLVNVANQAAGPSIFQIGSDGGFLNAPVRLGAGNVPQLLLAPAERADIIIDFAGQAGRTFTLVNTANAPFPSGDPPDPNTSGQIMQFVVNQPLVGVDSTFNPAAPGAARLRAANIVNVRPTGAPSKRRQLVLVEVEGPGGPEGVLLNNSQWDGNRAGAATATVIPGSVSNGAGISATETPQVGSTEIWEFANLTEDAHPIHLHLVQFQVINRQNMTLDTTSEDQPTTYRAAWDALFPGGTFGGVTYDRGTFIPGFGPPLDYATGNAGALGGNLAFGQFLMGGVIAPPANEAGWKDTLKLLPKQVTRIAVRFAPQSAAVGAVVAGMNAFSFDPTAAGPGYAWHCHILDHEDNEMMRPYLMVK